MQPATSASITPSAYTIENTTEPGYRQKIRTALRPVRSPHQPAARRCTSTVAIAPPIPDTITPAIVVDRIL